MTDTALVSVPEPVDRTEIDELPAPAVPPEAQRAAALVAVELDRIQQAARNTDRIASDPEMIAVWLRNQVSDHTRTSYEHAWNAWQAHSGSRPLGETTLADLQAFQAALARDRRPGSVNTMMSALRSAFALAHRKGYIRSNPCAEINDLPNPHRSGTAAALGRRILTRTETARLLEAARPGRDFALYLTLYHTGCRVSEALALRWEDLNLEGLLPTLTVLHGKGGKGRVIRLSEPLRETLVELQAGGRAAGGPGVRHAHGPSAGPQQRLDVPAPDGTAGRHRARHQPALVPARPRQPRPRRRRPRPVRQGDAGPRLAGHHLDLRPRPQRRRQRPVAGLRHLLQDVWPAAPAFRTGIGHRAGSGWCQGIVTPYSASIMSCGGRPSRE